MRRAVLAAIVVAICAAGALYYFAPGSVATFRHALTGGETNKAANAKASARPVAVVTAQATTADFPVRRYAIGFVSSPAVVGISARISSEVTQIHVKDGQMVQAGDPLFALDDRSLKAQVARDEATLAKDRAMLASAQADMSRAQDLAAKEAGTKQAYDQALAVAKAAEATVDADQATLDADNVQLSYATIAAPISGRLGIVNVTVGDLVTASSGNGQSTPLVTITSMDPLQVTFNLPESDLPLLQKSLSGSRPATVTLRRDGEQIGTGTVDFLDSSVDTASGTIAVKANVPNPGLSLWPGQYADIVVEAGTAPAMTSVPTVAVQSGQKGPFVYVVKADGTVEIRPIKVALTVGDDTALSEGLKSGERVVVEGQTRLTAGTPVREGGDDTAAAGTGPVAEDSAAGGPAR